VSCIFKRFAALSANGNAQGTGNRPLRLFREGYVVGQDKVLRNQRGLQINAVTLKKDPLMIKNCCDFKALEAACAEYAKRRLAEHADTNDTE
jgi:hypothetical protein